MAYKDSQQAGAAPAPVLPPAERLKKLPLTKKVAADGHVSDAYLETVLSIIPPEVTDGEVAAFFHQITRTNLDPMARQIYLVPRWDNSSGRNKYSVQVGIDGYRLIADRTGLYAGSGDTIFDDGLTQYQWTKTGRLTPVTATVTVTKLLSNGAVGSFTATALWESYYPGDKMGYMWKKFPLLMLGKVAEALALRKAFPSQLSGLYIAEEMAQAGESQETTAAISASLGYKNSNAIPTLQKAESAFPEFKEEWLENAAGVKFADVPATTEGDAILRKVWQYAVAVGKGTAEPSEEAFIRYFGPSDAEHVSKPSVSVESGE